MAAKDRKKLREKLNRRPGVVTLPALDDVLTERLQRRVDYQAGQKDRVKAAKAAAKQEDAPITAAKAAEPKAEVKNTGGSK